MKSTFVDKSIKYYRKGLKIKQSELAEKIGVTFTDMSFIENKRIYPDSKTAELLAEILKVPIGKIYSDEELSLINYRSN
jgi:DNA-binding XRE family transcriptional regulator